MRLVYLTLAWSAGILISAGSHLQTQQLWWVCLLFSAAALALSWREPQRRAFLLLVVAFTLGGLRFQLAPLGSSLTAYHGQGGLTLEGRIADSPRPRSTGYQFRLEAEQLSIHGRTFPVDGAVLVQTPLYEPLHYDQYVRVTGELFLPPTFDGFSYAEFLARTGVFSLMPNAFVEVVSAPSAPSPGSLAEAIRGQARSAIRAALPEPHASLLTGILLGDESGLAPEIEEAYARTGTAHIIAISGFNMVVVSGIVLAVLRQLRTPIRRRAIIAIGVIAVYTLFVGASPAVLRAALMSSLLIVGSLLVRRKTFAPASLAFATLVLTAWNPNTLWDVGFQLSLFATLGIVLFATPMSRSFEGLAQRLMPQRSAHVVQSVVGETLIVSLAAQILTLPLIGLYFERLSLVSLIVNVLIVPLQPAVLVLGALGVIASFVVPVLGQLLLWLTLVPLAYTTGIVRMFASLPFADIVIHLPPNAVALFFLVVIGSAMVSAVQPDWWLRSERFVRRRPVIFASAAATALLLSLMGALITSRPDGRLHVWLLPMGHSNAVLAQTPGGAQILVDGGRFPSSLLLALGDRLPFNDRTIDVLVVSQPDELDYGALPEVLNYYDAGMVLSSGHPNLSPTFTALQAAWEGHNVVEARAGYSLTFSDGVRLDVLHPQERPTLEDSLDDEALVLRLSYGGASFLISGDVSSAGQRLMVESGSFAPATALLMPQHGTGGALADEFLAAAAPQLVLLQSDPANRRGDPHPDTMAKVEGIPIYRTDEGGAIHISTDGTTLRILQG